MRTVYKYVLDQVRNEVHAFEGAEVLHVANQFERITVWLEVNTLSRECTRVLHVVPTGAKVPLQTKHVGSVLMEAGTFVFHVYDEGDRG